MRLAILSREFPPAIGGIGDHTDRLASELARRGNDVTVVCGGVGEARADVRVTPVGSSWNAEETPGVIEAVRAARPDAIVWQYNPFSIGRRGLAPHAPSFARSLAGIAPLTLSLHELWFPWGRSGARGLLWAVSQRLQGRAVLRHARHWVVTTEQREQTLRRIDPSRVTRIPIGANIEPSDASMARDEARDWLGLPADAFALCHLGATGSGRDFGPVAFAIRELRARGVDARLVFAGRTGPMTVPSGLEQAVVVTGELPRDRLSSALLACDAYIHADPVGPAAGRRGTLVAALAHGLPVVAYAGPDRALELVDGTNIVLVDRTGASVARALRTFLDDPGRAARIGRQGRVTYDERFSWTCIGEAFSVVLENSIR